MDTGMHITGGARRPEDIALDLTRFIAETTNYGKTSVATPGAAGGTPEEQHAEKLLQLFRRCVAAVQLGA